MGGGVAAGREVVAQECGVDVAIVGSCAPVAEVAVAEVVGVRGVGEEGDHAVLGDAFGARGRGHRYVRAFRSSSSLLCPYPSACISAGGCSAWRGWCKRRTNSVLLRTLKQNARAERALPKSSAFVGCNAC